MGPDSSHVGFNDTVELLSNVLPARALQQVITEIEEEARVRLELAGVNDASIAALLDTEGVPRYQIARKAVRDAGASEETAGDVFGRVDARLRGDNNPMILHVRMLVEDVLTQ